MLKTSRTRRLGIAGATLVAAGAIVLAGCAATSPSGTTTTTAPDPAEAAVGTCGSVPDLGANDPSGLLAGFSDDVVAGFNGYPFEVRESAWADFASEKDGDYTAAIVGMPPASPFIATLTESLRTSLKEADVEIVADLAPDEPSNVPLQLQQFNEALALKPDIIFYMAIAPEPAVDLATAAGEAGIPVVAVQVPIDSEYAVTVTGNPVLQQMETSAGVLASIGGSGSVLRVAGIPGIPNETWAQEGVEHVLDLCPDVSLAGEVTGLFQPPTAQSAVLQFLATNPAGVDAVLQSGTMGLGILNAFEESGLPVPPINENGGSRGFGAWALNNPDYPYFGTSTPAVETGEVAVQVGLRILAGAGPKVNHIVNGNPLITQENLADYVSPSDDQTDFTDLAPLEGEFLPAEQLDQYFTNPSAGS